MLLQKACYRQGKDTHLWFETDINLVQWIAEAEKHYNVPLTLIIIDHIHL